MSTIFVEMPLYTDLKYRYSMSLEGQSWTFTFYWNQRCSMWQMDIRMEDQTPIVLGYQIVPQYPMCEDYTLEDFGITGHFVLLPINATISGKISQESDVMPEFFRLYYVYNQED